MMVAQAGRCAVCEKVMKHPQIDHCHTTKVVRGLLCGKCNRMLGMAKDRPSTLESAAAYLRKSGAVAENWKQE